MRTLLESTDGVELVRSLTPHERKLVDATRDLVPVIRERAAGYDAAAAFPQQDIDDLAEIGLLMMTVPEEYGGSGLWSDGRYLPYYLVLEVLAGASMSTAWALRVHCNASGMVAAHGSPEQKKRVFAEIANSNAILATIGSEADPKKRGEGKAHPTGTSDLMRTDDGYILNTTKHFSSNAPAARFYVVHTEAPGGGTRGEQYQFVLVPNDAEGVSLEDNWDIMGARATASWAIHFKNVHVPWADVMGEPGDWVYRDARTMTASHAAVLVGSAEGALEFIRNELVARPSLAENEYVSYRFGELDSMVQAARTSLWYAALVWEKGSPHDAELASLRAVHVAKETALTVVSQAMEIYGARGTFRTLPLELYYRDLRVLSLHHRESNLMRLLTNGDLGHPYHSKQNYGPPMAVESKAAASGVS